MSFARAMIEVRRSEGGYVNDPDDTGGETYCGVSRKFFPKWEGWFWVDSKKKILGKLKTNYKIKGPAMIKALDSFYYKYFWKPLKCDKINNPIIAEHLFDCGINLGKKSAVRFFQETMNKHFGDCLTVDGLIGPFTIGQINKGNKYFANILVQERIKLYFSKCFYKPVKYKYLKGWCLRSLKYLQKV